MEFVIVSGHGEQFWFMLFNYKWFPTFQFGTYSLGNVSVIPECHQEMDPDVKAFGNTWREKR